MLSEPKLEYRDEQPYVGIPARVTMPKWDTDPAQLWGEVYGWLGKQGVEPAGAPFIRYLVIDMDSQLELEVGVPVASALPGDERIHAGVLPAGRYATLIYTGDYDCLIDANAAIQTWGAEKGEVWGGRIESYLTDPAEEPDPEKWETEVAYLVADD